jgi:multiple sugar transport system permease protein
VAGLAEVTRGGKTPLSVQASVLRWRWLSRLQPFRGFQYVLLILLILFSDLPLVWIALDSLKPDAEIVTYPPDILPKHPDLAQYFQLFQYAPFGTYMTNSAVLATLTTILVVIMATMGAYAFVRFDFRFLHGVSEASLFAYMVPSILLLVPIARLFLTVGLQNNPEALVLIYVARLLPFGLWTLRSYFQGISVDLEQAAMVDGCTRLGAFLRVVVPQAVPGMIATGIFTFNASWSEYLFGSTLLTAPSAMTTSPGLALLNTQSGIIHWGFLNAGAVLVTLPVLALFIIGQSQLVDAWSGQGAVK